MGRRTRFLTIVAVVAASGACATAAETGTTSATPASSSTTLGLDQESSSTVEAGDNTGTVNPPVPEVVMAFVRQAPQSENSDVYLLYSDGGETQLTENEAFDESPSFSPDGTKLTFDSNRTGDWEVYLVNVDGTGLTQLTDSPGQDGFTSWSPDGEALVMDSERDGDFEIYILTVADGELSQLTDNDAWDGEPAWSPDGETIVFHSDRDGDGIFDLYATDPTGASQTRLIENGFSPAWSPDGTSIVFTREPDDGSDRDIWLLDVQSGAADLLSGGEPWDTNPEWSADGTRIYFVSNRNETFNLYSMALDGSDVTLEIGGEDTVFNPSVRR